MTPMLLFIDLYEKVVLGIKRKLMLASVSTFNGFENFNKQVNVKIIEIIVYRFVNVNGKCSMSPPESGQIIRSRITKQLMTHIGLVRLLNI